MIVKGTVLGKYGTLLDPGWTEYGPISRVTVISNINGTVTLDCPLGALTWWGDMTMANCGMVCGKDIIRYWSDVGVHTVLRQPVSKTKLRDNERKKRELAERMVQKFGDYCNNNLGGGSRHRRVYTIHEPRMHMNIIMIYTQTRQFCVIIS